MDAEALGDSLQKWADKHGVSTMVAVVRDPDSEHVVGVRRGDLLWQVGAIESVKQELIDNWVDVKPKDA